MKGLFIVIEGLNGAGKSTQAKLLAEHMEKATPGNVLLTSEPWTSNAGRLIRTMLTSGEPMPSASELALLFACDRIAHCNEVIGPALAQGKTVISDRYYHSSIAYQGPWVKCNEENASRGLMGTTMSDGCTWVATINMWSLCPDLAIVLGVSPEKALDRMKGRTMIDVFDSDLERARAAATVYYRHLPKFLRGDNIIVADATGSEKKTQELILGLVEDLRGEDK